MAFEVCGGDKHHNVPDPGLGTWTWDWAPSGFLYSVISCAREHVFISQSLNGSNTNTKQKLDHFLSACVQGECVCVGVGGGHFLCHLFSSS